MTLTQKKTVMRMLVCLRVQTRIREHVCTRMHVNICDVFLVEETHACGQEHVSMSK